MGSGDRGAHKYVRVGIATESRHTRATFTDRDVVGLPEHRPLSTVIRTGAPLARAVRVKMQGGASSWAGGFLFGPHKYLAYIGASSGRPG